MFISKGCRLALFVLAALLVTDGAAAEARHHRHRAAPERHGPRPAIWVLEDADTRIYLFGTIHILPRGFRWRSPRFNMIARSADELVMEIVGVGAPESMADLLSGMELGKSAPLLWRVSPDRREALQAMVDDLGVSIDRFDSLHTWAAALVLTAGQAVRALAAPNPRPNRARNHAPQAGPDEIEDVADIDTDGVRRNGGAGLSIAGITGVEVPLEAEFRASHRPVSGVETIAQQMGFFGQLSFAEQRAFLDAVVESYARSSASGGSGGNGDIGQRDWVRGNVQAMAAMAEELREPLYDVLLRRRNIAWTEWLIHRMERPGTLLFAVGAAHLAGNDSVRALLAARGFRVRRIQ